ncbi:GTPase-activating protein [Podila humilis]|nr:GTPase-activating protein [Podila humilis]
MTSIDKHPVYASDDDDKDYDPYESYGPTETTSGTHNHQSPASAIDLSDYEEDRHDASSYQPYHYHDSDLKQDAPPKSPVSMRSSVSNSFYDGAHQDTPTNINTGYHNQRSSSVHSSPYQSRRTSALDNGVPHQSPASPTHSFHSHRSADVRSPAMTTSSAPQDAWGHALAPAQETAEVSRNSWEENDSEEDLYPADAYDYGQEEEESSESEFEERRISHASKKSFGEFDPNPAHATVAAAVAAAPSLVEEPAKEHSHDEYDSDYHYGSQHTQQEKVAQSTDGHQAFGNDDHHVQQHDRHQDSPRSSLESIDQAPRVVVAQTEVPASFSEAEPFYDVEDEEPKGMYADAVNRASVASASSYSSHTKHHSFGYEDRPAEDPSESDSESDSDQDNSNTAFVATAAVATAAAAAIATAVALKRSSSPKPPPVPTKSRPTSGFSVASNSTPGSPVLSRSMANHQEQTTHHAVQAALPISTPVDNAARSPIGSPVTPKAAPALTPIPAAIQSHTVKEPVLVVDTVSQKSMSSASSVDQRQRRYSDSDSDTSGTSIDLHSPTPKNHMNTSQSSRPNPFTRTMSTSSASREMMHGSNSMDKQRPISYATVFSDAELNDISLDEPSNEKRASAIPRTPVTPSAFGFPSSFFGGRPHPKAQPPAAAAASGPAPVPTPLDSVQHQQQNQSPPTPAPAAPAPQDLRANMTRSNSISALASSLQGAFRGFGASSQSQTPPPPTPKIPNQISQRGSDVGFFSSNNPRNSNQIHSDRASTISNMTTDSNMDLLLARLEAQNELLEKDSKQRKVTPQESEMDRAIGHAKEESTGENVDWDYWGALMHDYNGVVKKNPKQLTTMIQKGVPSALRGLIWQLLAKSKDTQLEATYAELLKSSSTHEKQITRDLSRTFPNHEYFQADGPGQEALFNVVKAYSLYDTEVGYCQGLSFVVGPLLLNMPDEEAFCLLVRMMNSYEIRGHYTPDMNMLQLRLYQFEQLMEETVPLVFKHLRNQGIRSTMYASQWFMTVFAYKFPLELVFRVYDIIFVEGVEALLRFAIALLKTSHDKILGLDFDVLIEFLKNGLFEPYMNDSSLFIQDAYNVKVTPKKLAQYAQKYQAMIQKQQAELAAEESLKESNRQLSEQVRRLEGSMQTLNKEHIDLAKELITRKMEMAQLHDQNDVLSQKVTDLTKIVDSQAKEVEDKLKGEIDGVLQKNMDLLKKNESLEDQMAYLENLVIETKMRYAESENERDALSRKLSDMRKALGMV